MKFIDWAFLAAITLFTLIPALYLIYIGIKEGSGKLIAKGCWRKRVKYKTKLGGALAFGWFMIVHYSFAIPAVAAEIPVSYRFGAFSIPLKVEWGTIILIALVLLLLGTAAIDYLFNKPVPKTPKTFTSTSSSKNSEGSSPE